MEGDASPDGKGTLGIARGIEVGHVFQLGEKYAKALGATVLDDQGKARVMSMGCYGIGVSRIVAAAIEQNVWPLIEKGAFKPVIDARFPLAQAEAALARMEQGAHSGKIVLLTE